jgi:UDP-N-acetylmuramoyl-L-alanyl-D-glutamate--2,6-diaminopimelate ligase
MTLNQLVAALGSGKHAASWWEREVSSVVQDSRRAGPGSLFVAVRGFHSDGHRFIPQALERGAVAVVAEEGADVETSGDAPVIRVADSRKALARLAAEFYGHPSTKLKVVGITGTKGKTTTSYLVRSIMETAGHSTGLIGTIGYRIGDRVVPAPNTTPESIDLQELLAKMVEHRATYCVMEVSSHALALGRTDGCIFEAAAFTNLAPEHLDFHGSMDDYFASKLKLFAGLGTDKTAVVNKDDARCGELLRGTTAKIITYGWTSDADVRPDGGIGHDRTGLRFPVVTPLGQVGIESKLVGTYNVQNILAAVGLAVALGCSRESIAEGIRRMGAVPGRMERVDVGQDFSVIVDYAHTEESLESVLRAVGDVGPGRVITLFGCGGDRDRAKRPRMGAAALAGSDLVIVTSDNPRTEDPLSIIRDIESGMREQGYRAADTDARPREGKKPYLLVPDRRDAITAAITAARSGDVVVLAGKGHEDYQIIGDEKHHFDDREEARIAITKLRRTAVR